MSALVLTDVENLWHGCRRITGRRGARVDFKRLLDPFRTEGMQPIAYVVTPRFPGEPVKNGAFLGALKYLGFTPRQTFVEARRDGAEVFVGRAHPTVYDLMLEDYVVFGGFHDTVVLVSGVGHTLPLARKVKEDGRRLVVACFDEVGDLHSELREIADEVVTLDASLVYTSKDRRDG